MNICCYMSHHKYLNLSLSFALSHRQSICGLISPLRLLGGLIHTAPTSRKLLILQRVTSILSYLLPLLQSLYISAVVPPVIIVPLDTNITSFAVLYDNIPGQRFTRESVYALFLHQIPSLSHYRRYQILGFLGYVFSDPASSP